MKTYNRALDFMALAANEAHKGNIAKAAKCLATAVKQKDLEAGLMILEASNAQAFEIHEKTVRAALAKKQKAAAAASKKPVVAADEDEDEALDELVGPIDELEDDMDDVEEETDEVDEMADDEEVDAEVDHQALAVALAKLLKPAVKANRK